MGAIRESATSQSSRLVLFRVTTPPTVVSSVSVDTAGYQNGIYFIFAAYGVQPGGIRTMLFSHSDAYGGPYIVVDKENLIFGRGGDSAAAIINNDSVPRGYEGELCAYEGIVGNKRWVRVSIFPSGSPSPDAAWIVCTVGDVGGGPSSKDGSVVYTPL